MVRYAFHMTKKQHGLLIEESTARGIGIPELLRRILDGHYSVALEEINRDESCVECGVIGKANCSEASHNK